MAGPTIYLFEDDEGLRSLLNELLEDELQARVVIVPSISEMLRLCHAQPPDLVVADFWGSSHLRLADEERSQIAALGELAPAVLVSARRWAQDAGSDELGLAAVVSKPIDLESFIGVLRQALAASSGTDETVTQLPPREALSVVVLPWASEVP